MGKLSDLFSMSKQERVGAWMIAALIVLLLVAVAVEKKCTHDSTSSTDAKTLNEYVEKAQKSKPKEDKKPKTGKKKGSKASSDKKRVTKDKGSKAKPKATKKSKNSSKSKSEKKSTGNKQRELQPVPQF